MRRAVRYWEQGLPLPAGTLEEGLPLLPATVGGRPCAVWLDLFMLCHQPVDGGWLRGPWPDGRPLLEQSWPQVAAFRVIADELAAIRAEHLRKRTKR